jgi:hypothetical protein
MAWFRQLPENEWCECQLLWIMFNVQTPPFWSVVLLLPLLATAQAPTNGPSSQATQRTDYVGKGSPCLFDFERGVVPDCIHAGAGKLFVSEQYLHQLTFDSSGLAPIRSEAAPYGWMYVNRKGKVVITGVPTLDNWADEFHEGLVRTVKNGKVGFANRKGKLVIPPNYDWAWPFENGVAEVCNGCREECTGDCEHRIMVGGKRFQINRHGALLRQLPQ